MRRLLILLALLAPAPARGSELDVVGSYSEGGAAEIEVAGNLAFLVAGGVDIVSIADPANPKRIEMIECRYASDAALDPAAQILVIAIEDGGNCMPGTSGGILVYDVRDPAQPERLAEVVMPAGAHTLTMDGRTLYANQPDDTAEGPVRQLEVFDLSDPVRPRPLNLVQFTGHGPHESYVRHRPDGRSLLYTANSIGGAANASVLDVTDPSRAGTLQTISDPAINYAHQAEVSFDDQVILLSDELLVGSSYGACGQVAPGAGHGGGLHFYKAAPDGTYADDGRQKLGVWNVAAQVSGAEQCTIHNFMQAPDARRLLVTWYSRGTYLLDFTEPASVEQLAAIMPEGGLGRAAIAHNGLIYTADARRGMDVLRFRGEGWPANAGPVEAFRFGRLPATAPPPLVAAPAMPPPAQPAGRARLRLKLRRAARLAVLDSRGVQVARARVRRGRSSLRVVALPGRYRWVARAGRRVVARGRFAVRRTVPGLTLASGTVARVSR